MLSLASLFNSDVRRSLLALQVSLETGSSLVQRVPAPIYGLNIPLDTSSSKPVPLNTATDAVKPPASQPMDSGDEFVEKRTRKRRALRVESSDEDSSDPPTAVVMGNSDFSTN